LAHAIQGEDTKRCSKGLDQSDRGSRHIANSIVNSPEVNFAFNRFKSDITSIFGEIVFEPGTSGYENMYRETVHQNIINKKPIVAITARKKSAESLSEKMGSKKILSKKAVYEQITDLLGVKILISGNDAEAGNYVVQKLTKAVKAGWIKVVEIEHHKNPLLRGRSNIKYAYANQSKLDELADTARAKGIKCENSIKDSESGYSAIHMLVELPNGLKGEIQIMGVGVSRLKEIEDMCYKATTNKHLPKKYSEIETMFSELAKDDKLYAEFMEYTRLAYAHERQRPLKENFEEDVFLTIPRDFSLPEKYDFNYVAKIKHLADNREKKMSAAQV